MTIPYVLLVKNFGPQSVCHAVAQLFAVGRGFETRPGLQVKNSKNSSQPSSKSTFELKTYYCMHLSMNRNMDHAIDWRHMKLAFISA